MRTYYTITDQAEVTDVIEHVEHESLVPTLLVLYPNAPAEMREAIKELPGTLPVHNASGRLIPGSPRQDEICDYLGITVRAEDTRRELADLHAAVGAVTAQRDQRIREAVADGLSMYAVAKATGLSQAGVAKIVRRG